MILNIKLIAICLIVYYQNSLTNCVKLPSGLLPDGFNLKDASKFRGFDAFHFDGNYLNPFYYEIDNVLQRYAEKHNRKYTDDEIQLRKDNLRKSLEIIQQHIIDSINNKPTYNLGLTSLSDRTEEEFRQLSGTKFPSDKINHISRTKRSYSFDSQCNPKSADLLPQSLDWRQKNIVTPIKNQGQCGSCWAHAAAATIESAWANKTKQIIDLSEQDLVNCVASNGCNGGIVDDAYNYVIKNGISQESVCPYTASAGPCKHYPLSNGVQISDFCRFGGSFTWTTTYSNGTKKQVVQDDSNSDDRIMRDLRDNGPVVGSMYASNSDFQNYVSGIYNPSSCSTQTDHAIVLVGWGTENGINYWIIKNSWGTSWGEKGFFRIARGRNLCGINNYYFYPILQNANYINKSS